QAKYPFRCVTLVIRVKLGRPMRMRESTSWVLGAIAHGRLGEGVGTVLVGEGVQEVDWG
nr:hypothetical protein [Tanacetum cinerariifolium]